MIIVDERNFIKKAILEQGLNLFDFYDKNEQLNVTQFTELSLKRRSDVLLVDTQSILNNPNLVEVCKAMLNTFQGVFFFHEKSNEQARKWVEEHSYLQSKILGECSLPMSQLSWTMLANQLQFFWSLMEEQRNLQKHMVAFSQELDQVLQTAEVEMSRAKKIHEILIPKRNEEIKGVRFYNKYATGESGGAEFYDLVQSSSKVYQILISSESYLISSALLGILNAHKQSTFNPQDFLKDSKNEIDAINGTKKRKASVDLLVLELDLSKLILRAWGKNKVEFFSQSAGQVTLSKDETYQLGKGEKFIVFSPGFIFNWNEGNKAQSLYSFVKNHQGLDLQDLMTELFFQIRQEVEGQFLKKDATVAMMEVNRHGMHQV